MKRCLLAVMLLMAMTLLSGCVRSISKLDDPQYDAAKKELIVPVQTRFYERTATGGSIEDTDYNSDIRFVMYYSTDPDKVNDLKNMTGNESSTPPGISSVDSQSRIRDDGKEIDLQALLADGIIELGEYCNAGGRAEKSKDADYEYADIQTELTFPGIELSENETLYYRLCYYGKAASSSDILIRMSDGFYTFRYVAPDSMPSTGDSSNIMPFIFLLAASALALCGLSLRRRRE